MISENSISGMIAEPCVEICSISDRRVERSRCHEAVISFSRPWTRDVLMSAKRSGRGVRAAPKREAKTDEMSPSFLAARDAAAAAATVLRGGRALRIWRERPERQEGENILNRKKIDGEESIHILNLGNESSFCIWSMKADLPKTGTPQCGVERVLRLPPRFAPQMGCRGSFPNGNFTGKCQSCSSISLCKCFYCCSKPYADVLLHHRYHISYTPIIYPLEPNTAKASKPTPKSTRNKTVRNT